MAKDENVEMESAFYAGATLKSEFAEVKKWINGLKSFRIISDGNVLKYEMHEGKTGKPNGLLELSADHICLRFFFAKQDRLVYGKALLTFISLIALLKDSYDVRFEDVYGYIIAALGQNWHGLVKDQSFAIGQLRERVVSLDESNCSLSLRIMDLSRENAKVSSELSLHKRFSSSMMGRLNAVEPGNEYIPLTGTDFELISSIKNSLALSDRHVQ